MVHEEYSYLSGELQRKQKNGLTGVRGSRWRHIGLCNRLIVAAPVFAPSSFPRRGIFGNAPVRSVRASMIARESSGLQFVRID
jgi:hypothetical protein